MLTAGVQITLSRAKNAPKTLHRGLIVPVLLALSVTLLLMVSLVTELIVRPQPWYAPQLVVPLAGMLLGNTVSALAVGLSRFFESMKDRRDDIGMLLALGATPWEASRPSVLSSIRLGLMPTTASLASAGIVTIPGMMAGQVIAGGDPRGHRRTDPTGRQPDHAARLPILLRRSQSPTPDCPVAPAARQRPIAVDAAPYAGTRAAGR